MKIVSYLNFFILAFSLLFMSSCTKENAVESSESVEVIASLPASTRLSYSSANGVTTVSWVEGDVVGVCKKKSNEPLNLQYVVKNSGLQTPLEPAGTSELKLVEGDSIVAYYPYLEDIGTEATWHVGDGGVPYKGFGTQNQNEGLQSYDCLYAKGVVEDNKVKLQFHHLFPIVRIIFPSKIFSDFNVNIFQVQSTEMIADWGNGSGVIFPESPTIENMFVHFGAKFKYLNYYLDPDSLKEESVTCNVVMFPQPESAEITIRVPWTENIIQVFRVPAGGLKAGHLYKLDLTAENRFITDEGSIDSMPECEW